MTRPCIAILLLVASFAAMPLAAQPVTYQVEPVPEDLEDRFEPDQIALLEMLNRADTRHLPRLEKLVVPDRWDLAILEYSPLPANLDALAGLPKALVVHQPHQVIGAYEHGRLVRWGPVSSGRRKHPTPSGSFQLNWRSRSRHSTEDPDWFMEWYYNFHNRRGLALHQYALPGVPASHACVRLLERDAKWIYEWGDGWTLDERQQEILEPGTPLWIIGDYEFDVEPPWLDESAPHQQIDIDPSNFPED